MSPQILIVLLALFAVSALAEEAAPATQPASPLDLSVQDIHGHAYDLSQHRGQVVMIVNTASKCGLTPQYAGLEKLYAAHKDQGLVIIGFPANNFGNQEPGTNAQIQEFCTANYGVTFPMMSKISVKGDDIHPLYALLTSPSRPTGGEIGWNFTKFLVNREGQVIARFDSGITPDDPALVEAVKMTLEEPAK